MGLGGEVAAEFGKRCQEHRQISRVPQGARKGVSIYLPSFLWGSLPLHTNTNMWTPEPPRTNETWL